MLPNVDPRQLRRVHPSELTAGMVLPGDLRDRDGSILVQAGRTLSQEQLSALERESDNLYAGSEWPDKAGQPPEEPADAAEIVKALRLRRGARGDVKLRRHQRHPCTARLKLVVEARVAGGCEQYAMEVTTCDISASGFAFIYPWFIHVGTIIHATFEALPQKPQLTAVVRNCIHLAGREHRVGAEFTQEPESSS